MCSKADEAYFYAVSYNPGHVLRDLIPPARVLGTACAGTRNRLHGYSDTHLSGFIIKKYLPVNR